MEVEEDEIDTDDSEELRRPSAEGCEQGSLSVVYDIAYSTSYQVPVLYLHFRDPDSSVVRPDPALLERVIPTISNPQVQTVGTIGGISMTVRRAFPRVLPVQLTGLSTAGPSHFSYASLFRAPMQHTTSHACSMRWHQTNPIHLSGQMDWMSRYRCRPWSSG